MPINYEAAKTLIKGLVQKMKSFRGNWEQNDPTADDYIKNRPFYTEDEKETVIIPKMTVSISDNETIVKYSPIIPFEIGQTYNVLWNGYNYSCVASELEGLPALGDFNFSSLPFCIVVDEDMFGGAYIASPTNGNYTVSVTCVTSEVHKIDKKYLPNMNYLSYKENQDLTYEQQETALSNVGDALHDSVSYIVNRQKSVKYTYQSLSTSQQATARNNIGAAASADIPTNVVKYTAQTMTDAQKAQARTNIGAGTGDYNDLTNKPVLATVATSGSYNDLSNKPTIAQSDWNTYSTTNASYIKNRICYDDCKDTNIGLSGITKANSLDSSSGLYYNSYSTYSDYSTLAKHNDESLLFAMRYPTSSDDKIEFRYKKYNYQLKSNSGYGVLQCWGNPYLLFLRLGTEILDGTSYLPLSENELDTGEPFLFVMDMTSEIFDKGLVVISRESMNAGSIYTRVHDIKTLDEKLIPETIARETDLSNYKTTVSEQFTEVDTTINDHVADENNPHGVTKEQIGLDVVDNTSDMDKPVSYAMQTALDEKANIDALDGKQDIITGTSGQFVVIGEDGKATTKTFLSAEFVVIDKNGEITTQTLLSAEEANF